MRLGLWKDSMNIVKDFTITGSGFGSFLSVYPKYRTIPDGSVADHAHNDYIEFLTEGGLLGVVLFGWFLVSVFLNAFATFRKRRDRYAVYMFIGAVTGIAAILIHSIIDFNLQIGANGLYFFLLLGLLVSAANTRFSDALRDPYLEKMAVSLSRLALYTVATVVLLLLCVVYNVGTLLGNYYHSSIDRSRLESGSSVSEIEKIRDLSRKASAYDPMEGRYRFTYADAEWLLNNKSEALASYIKAVRLDPLKGEYIQKLGLVMSEGGKHDRADVLLKFGTTVDRQNPHRYQIYGSWQIKEGKRKDGIKNVAKAIAIEPGKTKDYIILLVLHGLSDKEIQSALPDLVQPHMKFAKYLEKTGNHEMATEEYRKVLSLDPDNTRAKRMLEKLQ
jgi:tetratricopeptide (TPR) repeat protein